MQRILGFGKDIATSTPFTVPAGGRVKLWMVREDTTRNPSPHDSIEIQVQDQTATHWTTVGYLNYEAPSYTLGPDSEDLVYRAYRLQQTYAIAVDRTEPSADARDGQHAAPVNFVPANQLAIDNTNPPVSCSTLKVIYATNPNNVNQTGVTRTFPTAAATDFGNLTSGDIRGLFDTAQPGVFSLVRDNVSGNLTLHIERTGVPALTMFVGSTISLLNPNGSVAFSTTILAGDVVSATTITKVIAGVLPFGADTWMVVCPSGMSYAPIPLVVNSGRFTLDQNDVPARLSATGFDPDAPFEDVRLCAVENNNVIPLTYDEGGGPIRLTQNFRSFTIIAPGEYEWRRTSYSNISIYLNTGWR